MQLFKTIYLVLAVALTSMSSHGAFARDFEKGFAAYHRGDFKTALKEWRPLAEQGEAVAQYYLGQMYRRGEGVPLDDGKAVKWWRKAAEHGHADAQYNLAWMYRKTAEGGNATSQSSLGLMYYNGDFVPQDYEQAAKWYRRAAEQGNAFGQYKLGRMYFFGQGLKQDSVYAHIWASMAASLGSENGKKARNIFAKRMTAGQVAKAKELARECVKKNYKDC
jgi:TPR repeat protein